MRTQHIKNVMFVYLGSNVSPGVCLVIAALRISLIAIYERTTTGLSLVVWLSPHQEFLRFFLDGLAEDLNRRSSSEGQTNHHHHHQHQHQHQHRGGGHGGQQQQQRLTTPPPPPVVPTLSDEEISRLTAEQQADRAWALHLARNDSEITGMFCGQLQSRISCLNCGNVSFCFDPFFDLSVPLPTSRAATGGGRGADEGGYGGRSARGSSSSSGGGSGSGSASGGPRSTATSTITLEDCLRAFSTVETLDGDNRPVCDRCGRRRKAQKRLAVHRFPPILVIHLKRFQFNSTSRTKLSTAVEFPIGSGLNLAPYSTPEARLSSPGSSGSGGSSDGDKHKNDGDHRRRWNRSSSNNGGGRSPPPVYYELYAVCNHMGGLQGGHYTAHCRSRSSFSGGGGSGGGGGVSAGEWHTFDDARVGPVNASRVGGASAYVLFYRLLANKEDGPKHSR